MIERILLIDVDIARGNDPDHPALWSHHPIGLLYLASAVRERFPEITFTVLHTATRADYLAQIAETVREFKPDLVGLRSLSVARAPFDDVARQLRGLCPGVPIVGGGPYPSASCRELLQQLVLDLVVIGEGEITFTELVARLRGGGALPDDLAGTAVIVDGALKTNPARELINDIDRIAFPDYGLISLQDYRGISNHALTEASEAAFICSSRGCPFQCFYCHQLFGKKVRRRSPENVVAEMRAHVDERGITCFVFVDDVFNVPLPVGKALLRLIINELPKVQISFPNGLRADFIDEEMVDLLEQAGTMQLALAIETATPQLQKMVGKNLDLDKAHSAIDMVSRRLVTRVYYMVGFPTETYADARRTLNYAASLEHVSEPILNVVRVYENTPLYGYLDPDPGQARALASQAQQQIVMRGFDGQVFYGDFFPDEKVPLKAGDIRRFRMEWLLRVIGNRARIRNSHAVLARFLPEADMLRYYKNVYNNVHMDRDTLRMILASCGISWE